jgi:hypothetical protein
VYGWLMNGLTLAQGRMIYAGLPLEWEIEGIVDLGGESWRLTTTVVSLEVPPGCSSPPVGTKWDGWTLSALRRGAQVYFTYYDRNGEFYNGLVGAVNEQSFTAVSDNYRGFWPCAGTVTISSSVVGSFSSDDRTLSGRERLIYRVDGGSELIIAFGVERHAHMSSPRLG